VSFVLLPRAALKFRIWRDVYLTRKKPSQLNLLLLTGSFQMIQLRHFPGGLDTARRLTEDRDQDRGAIRTEGRDFPTRGENPSNLKRIMPPEGVGKAGSFSQVPFGF